MEGKKNKIGIIIIIITYLVGIVGFLFKQSASLFSWMVPFHLLLVFCIIMWTHKKWNFHFILFFVLSYVISYLAELTGVHTGLLFGDYKYGHVLGLKVFQIPLMIGINWFMLVYAAHSVSEYFISGIWTTSVISGTILTILDFVMEPAAIKLGFWYWHTPEIPAFNYICWFGLSFILSFLAKLCAVHSNFYLSVSVLASQLLFFIILQ